MTVRSVVDFGSGGRTRPAHKNRCSSMPPAISLKTVTNNVGWSVLSKTSTFGLKFVTVPIVLLDASTSCPMRVIGAVAGAGPAANPLPRFAPLGRTTIERNLNQWRCSAFRTRNPNGTAKPTRPDLPMAHRFSTIFAPNWSASGDGLRDRYENVAADAAFSQQALENDRAGGRNSRRRSTDMTETISATGSASHRWRSRSVLLPSCTSQWSCFPRKAGKALLAQLTSQA